MWRSRSVRQREAHPASRTRAEPRSHLGRPRGGVMRGGPGGEGGDGPEPAGGAPEVHVSSTCRRRAAAAAAAAAGTPPPRQDGQAGRGGISAARDRSLTSIGPQFDHSLTHWREQRESQRVYSLAASRVAIPTAAVGEPPPPPPRSPLAQASLVPLRAPLSPRASLPHAPSSLRPPASLARLPCPCLSLTPYFPPSAHPPPPPHPHSTPPLLVPSYCSRNGGEQEREGTHSPIPPLHPLLSPPAARHDDRCHIPP